MSSSIEHFHDPYIRPLVLKMMNLYDVYINHKYDDMSQSLQSGSTEL